MQLVFVRFIRRTGGVGTEDTTKNARQLLVCDRFRRATREQAWRKNGAGSPRLLRVQEEGDFALRSTRSLPSRRCPDLAAIPRGLARTLFVGECRLSHVLLAGSLFGGACSAGQLLGRFLLQHRDAGYGRLWQDVSGHHMVASIEIVCGLALDRNAAGAFWSCLHVPPFQCVGYTARKLIAMRFRPLIAATQSIRLTVHSLRNAGATAHPAPDDLVLDVPQWPAGAAPPSFTLRRLSASGTAASASSVNTQKASM